MNINHTLLSAVTTNSDSSVMESNGAGLVTIQVDGTFGGATVTAKLSLDDGTTYTATDAVWTAAGVKNLELPTNSKLKLTITGASGTTSLSAYAGRH